MKRELRFRMWIKSSGTMVSHEDINYSHVLDHKESHDDIELMQFTGLLDRNGKEVFEGDLLQWFDEIDKTSTVYYEVFYDDGNGFNSNGFKINRTHYKGGRAGGYIPSFQSESVCKMVIIGNIYENPELLK